jgi:hypothetical protein
MGSCNPDGATIPWLIFVGFFIASTAGLFSKDKDTRLDAIKVGMGISFGGAVLYLLIGCN